MSDSDNFTIDLSYSEEDDNPANSLYKTCRELFAKSELVDCTISCSDGHLQAHRIILASASSYLCNLLTSTPLPTPCSHPILFLRNSSLADARSAMEYIYTGKTQTTKNRLSALLEVSQELGCASLVKAIENAIQTCGIETFRRLVQTPTTANSKSRNSVSPTIKIEAEEPRSHQIISVKHDIFEEPEDYDDPSSAEPEDMTITRNIHIPETTKRPATTIEPNRVLHPQSWKVPRLMNNSNGNKNGNKVDFATIKPSEISVSLQHDKGESFVYTNEDFVMKPLEHEEDENESGDDEDADIDVPQPVLNISELMKGDIKEEETVPASCPWCMQVFTNLALLQKHIRTHVSNYRPFSCEYCHNTFARSAHLKRHLRTHTGEKPYVCSICQRPFARQDKLKTHLERHLHHAAKPSLNSMSMTSYPPVSLSQNSGGQVPIKVLLPLGKQMNGNGSLNKFYNGNHHPSTNRFEIGTSNNNGLSISIANTTSSAENNRSVSGGLIVTPANMPMSTTITPVVVNGGSVLSNDCNKRIKVAKEMSRNFLVT